MTLPRLPLVLPAMLLLVGCARGALTPPSLAPRAAETIDPRLPVERALVEQPLSSSLGERLPRLLANARMGDAAFRAALGPAKQAAATAGASQTESWIAAQELLSALEAARAPTTRAVGDIDALAGEAVHAGGGIAAADFAAIAAAAAEVGALDRRQASEIAALTAQIGR